MAEQAEPHEDVEKRKTEYLNDQAASIRRETRKKITISILRTRIQQLEQTARESNWMLAITGASLPVVLASAEITISVMGTRGLGILIASLVVSALLGIRARELWNGVNFWRNLYEHFERELPVIADAHRERDEKLEQVATFLEIQSVPSTWPTPAEILDSLADVLPRKVNEKLRSQQWGPSDDPFTSILKGAVKRGEPLEKVSMLQKACLFGAAGYLVLKLLMG